MTDLTTNVTTSVAAKAAIKVERPQNRHLRPFPKGVSGNPSGLPGHSKRYCAVYTEQEAALIAYYGRALSPRETLLLDELVTLKLRRSKGVPDAVKRANSLSRLLQTLYGAEPNKPAPGHAFDQHIRSLSGDAS